MIIAGSITLLSAVGTAGGVLTARRSVRLATICCFAGLLLVAFKFTIAWIPAMEPNVFPWDFYPLVESWWYLPPVFFLLGAGLYGARNSKPRRCLLLVFGGLLLLRVGDIVKAELEPVRPYSGVLDDNGWCPQTTNFTCGPASAVMFLNLHGIRSNEDEMAGLCVTRGGMSGTTEAGLIRGLRRKGLSARAVAPDEIPAPAIASVWLNSMVSHAVVIVDSDANGVKIADPLGGFYTLTSEEFRERWMGSAIVAAP